MDKLLTVSEAAQLLACSDANVYALIDNGQLAYIPIGRSKGYRIDPRDLRVFIDARKEQKEGVKPKARRPHLKHISI